MASDSNEIDWNSLDEPQELAHEFEVDLNNVVVANHQITIEGIERSEDRAVAEMEDGFHHEDSETIRSIISHTQNFYDDLRRAARLLALVGVVTRLQHWISRFTKQLNLKTAKVSPSNLVNQIEALNSALGKGPVPSSFFEGVGSVRDSVVHGDAQIEWEFNGQMRTIPAEYRSVFGADLTDDQLKFAIEKSIEQVKWYDEKICGSSANTKKP